MKLQFKNKSHFNRAVGKSSRLYNALTLAIFVFCVSQFPSPTHGIQLDREGGYSLVVGIDSFATEPSVPDLNALIESIKNDFVQLSTWMYSSTHKFYLKNVEILLQSHAELVNTDAIALSENYENADAQISEKIMELEPGSGNECGSPGAFSMGLPLAFFSNGDVDPSMAGKALLHTFAQSRWGVFEEMGSRNDAEKFGRFYRTTDGETGTTVWKHTDCTDTPLQGSVESSAGETCNLQDVETYPADSCEFVPSPPEQQTATSSLMNYYDLDNMKEFCDKATHNKLAPSPQNIMCSYRSVMEVIRSAEDWNFVTEPIGSDPPAPTFRVLRPAAHPRLYVLIDRSSSAAPHTAIDSISSAMGRLLQGLDDNIVAGIGAFPSTGWPDKSVDELALLSLLSDLRPTAPQLITDNLAVGDVTGGGNFASALFNLTQTLQKHDSSPGTIIVILKVGPAISFENSPFENEIISSMKSNRILIHGLEIRGSGIVPGINLENLVARVGGSHTILTSESLDTRLQNFTDGISKQFEDPVGEVPLGSNKLIYAGPASSSQAFTTGGNVKSLHITLTSDIELDEMVLQMNGENIKVRVDKSKEWNDGVVPGSRSVQQAVLETGDIVIPGQLAVSLTCDMEDPEVGCRAYLVIFAEMEEIETEEPMTVKLSTSKSGAVFDWSQPGVVAKPARIFAKVSNMGDNWRVRLVGKFCRVNEPWMKCYESRMSDDGFGDPDVFKNDGIYSLAFVPPSDGLYRVLVSYQVEDAGGALLAERTLDYPTLLTFKGVELYQPQIRRITDLKVSEKEENSVRFTWTSPPAFTVEGQEIRVDSYEIRYAYADEENYWDLLDKFDDFASVPAIPEPQDPGSLESVLVNVDNGREFYLAIRAISSGSQSEVSNLVSSAFATIQPPDPPTTTTEPTTPEATTEPTTPEPTTEPSTPEVTTEPTTPEATTEPTTPEPTTEPSTPEVTTEPITPEVTTEPTTPEATTEPTTPEPTTEPSTPEVTTEPTTPEPTTMPSTPEPTTVPSTPEPTTVPSTPEPTTMPSTPEPTTMPSTPEPTTVPSTPEATTSRSTARTTPRVSSTPFSPTTTVPTTPETELFFKKPIGYITAAAGGAVALGVVGGAIGYLYWKRYRLIQSGRLKIL